MQYRHNYKKNFIVMNSDKTEEAIIRAYNDHNMHPYTIQAVVYAGRNKNEDNKGSDIED